jgi:hypothetical protein
MDSAYDKPAAYIAGRTSEGSFSSSGRTTYFIIDVGQDRAIALIRIRAEWPQDVSDIEQCRLELVRLIDIERARQAVKDGVIELLPKNGELHTLDDLIPQLIMAVSLPQGISTSFRDNR